MAFRQIKTPALADQSVIESKLGVDAIKQQTAEATGSATDSLLLYSAGSDALRKINLTGLIGSFTTDDLAEGSNLYFTDARAQTAVAQDIADAVAAEATLREAADTTLTTNLNNEIARATAAEGVLTTDLAAEVTRATTEESSIRSDFAAADTALQNQINNIISNVDPVALDSLTEIVNAFQTADNTLTAGINANATAIANETTARVAADDALGVRIDDLQTEVDTGQASLGLAADGSYVAHSGTNYIDSATSFKAVDAALDTQIKVVADALAAEISTTDGEITALQAADVTLQSNIDTVAADLVTEAATARAAEQANATAIQDEIAARVLDVNTEEARAIAAEGALQTELDATQTGAGLAADGAYVAPTTSNYHDAATSLADADMKIDAALKAVDTAYKAADTTLQSNIDAEETARISGDNALDARATTLEGEMDSAEGRLDALEANTGGTFTLDTTAQTLPGGINEIHGEVDAIEARVTTNEADIATNAASIANILSNTDPAALDSLTEIVAAFQAADSSLTGLINANSTAIATETTNRTNADNTLQANIDSEEAARIAADNTLQSNIDSEATTREAADTAATNDRALIRSEFAAADATIQGELDDTQTGAGLGADGSYTADATTNYLTAATSLKDADKKLDAQLKVVADGLAAEISTTDGEISALDTRVTAEEAATATATADRGAIRNEFAAADATLQTNINNVQSELDATQTGAGLNADGSYTANASSNYLTGATSLQDADNKLDTELKSVDTAYKAADTTLQSNIDAEAQTRANADTTLQTNIDNEETARIAADATHTANIATNTTNIATNAANLATEITRAQTAESDLQAELNDTQAGAGLAIDGSYVTPSGTNYIDASTTLASADALLDAAIKATDVRVDNLLAGTTTDFDTFVEVVNAFQTADSDLNAAITTLASDASTARSTIQAELDVTQTGAGLGADGTYTADATKTYIDDATSLFNADQQLDDAIVAETAARIAADGVIDTFIGTGTTLTTTAQDLAGAVNELNASTGGSFTALQAEVDAIETSLGLAADGTFVAHSGTNYIDAATTAKGARELLDAAIKQEVDDRTAAVTAEANDRAAEDTSIRTDFAAADSAIQSELDVTQTGAGLDAAGTYTAIGSANYISAATSLKDADNKLDMALKAVDTAYKAADTTLQTNIDNEAATRLANDTTLQSNIDAEATTRAAADTVHSNAITALETEMTATQAAAGLGTDGSYTANASANYIAAATTLQDADNKLDAAIKVNADGLAQEILDRTADVDAEEARAIAEEARIEGLLNAEVTRATAAETTNATNIQTNANNLAQELLDRAAADTNLQNQIDNIVSNTDPAALDSLTEIVAAFQSADSTLTGLVQANQTSITDLETEMTATQAAAGFGTDGTYTAHSGTNYIDSGTSLKAVDHLLDAAIKSVDTAVRADFAAADTAVTNAYIAADALKLDLAGGTMSGDIAMGGNTISGLADAVNAQDAVTKAQLDAVSAATSLSNFSTDDLGEGSTNLYYTDARVRAAITVTDTAGDGLVTYDSATGAIAIDTDKALLDLTDYIGTETDYANMANYVLSVNELGTGVELVDPSTLNFATIRRQTIDGDGTQTTFALNFATTQTDAMVFVGGVIQDPVTHYTLDAANQTITFVSAIPLNTQVVIMAQAIAAVPYIETGAVTYDKFAADIKAYKQQLEVTAGTGGDVVDSFAAATYRTGKYIIQVSNAAGTEFETREALVVHDGTNAYITEFAIVYTGSGLLGDASVQMNAGNVELVYTANSAGTTVKVISTYIDV